MELETSLKPNYKERHVVFLEKRYLSPGFPSELPANAVQTGCCREPPLTSISVLTKG